MGDRFELLNVNDPARTPALRGNIVVNRHGIAIQFDQYGENAAADGCGWPILIEFFDHPRIVIWGDINSDEPTHIISLEGAQESRRKDMRSSS